MALTKSQRETVRCMFDGRCAYCGEELGPRWHVDHVEAVVRDFVFLPGGGTRNTGKMIRVENDRLTNLMPACPPCNIDKHSMPLEAWRAKLARACEVLARNNPTYRHALRYGLIHETSCPVVFHFERVTANKQAIL
ncbi:hypothetical protein LMG31884_47280 (plasmid) [Xanthomonas hydrangeae]|uniref:HNH endonuclease n=1 Tax=Xanthomonas hydrangeae TaxID=2775159 RepID=UPI0019625238|nr:hypothetical protein LMG31884_47280 [Xanthomonas hydrangeae]CAD7741103.1 hypothetical protein LMG31884_47280 [Xanthomonas hydrangeae]CAD7747964.1 hypothetical protein LMG31887_46530 [Xanthomonas hydrangeae]CAD7747965.1 hypothetical protein LMG31887_46530 [Xanthomonas hydrangeae]CAD7748158.1 hypothetical protein LMG31885_44960 [Xanthomonas hydrangeae]